VDQFCCFGCCFAAKVAGAGGEQGQSVWTLTRLGMAVFLTLNVTVFSMALWTQDFYGSEAQGDHIFVAAWQGLFRYLSMLFSLPILVLLGGPILENSLQNLRRREMSMDLLLILGVAAAFAYSMVSVLRDSGPVYFEVGCVVLLLVTLGRWLEATGKLKTTAALDQLEVLLPAEARIHREKEEYTIPLDQLKQGDCVRVLAGERIPCDGLILRNHAFLDEQALTGESCCISKGPGDKVFGGTLDLDGDLHVAVTEPASSGALARMIELVREARGKKGKYQRLADRLSAIFIPAVMTIAIVTALYHGFAQGWDRGILSGLAVILIACPCALGLATPMAVWVALGTAARRQVLFRNGESMERLAGVRVMLFDKTGTLTTGKPKVADFLTEHSRDSVLQRAQAIAAASNHAYAQAIRRLADDQARGKLPPKPGLLETGQANCGDVTTHPGLGLTSRAPASGETVYLGSPRFMSEKGMAVSAGFLSDWHLALASGLPMTCVAWDGLVRGVFLFREELRQEARQALDELQRMGLTTIIVTGDHARRGATIAAELGVPVEADLLPADKIVFVERHQRENSLVAMVGDGINDAPALARSDVGIAMGCGTDVARESAGVCLLGNDLGRLPWTVALSKRTIKVIRCNLFWAFFYNVIGIGWACTGKLNPVLASAAMTLSSLMVIGNALRLGSADSIPSLRPGQADVHV
jgi:heavy metal translocating P-type ATPase